MTVITMPSTEKKADNVPLVTNIEIDPSAAAQVRAPTERLASNRSPVHINGGGGGGGVCVCVCGVCLPTAHLYDAYQYIPVALPLFRVRSPPPPQPRSSSPPRHCVIPPVSSGQRKWPIVCSAAGPSLPPATGPKNVRGYTMTFTNGFVQRKSSPFVYKKND